MATTEMNCLAGGGGSGINELTTVYAPTSNEGLISSTDDITVESGSYYLLSSVMSASNGTSFTVSATGGDVLSQVQSGAGVQHGGGAKTMTLVALIKATSSTMRVSVSGSYTSLYAGVVAKIS